MLSRETPLRGHTLFRSASAQIVSGSSPARGCRLHRGAGRPVDACFNRYEMPSGELCSPRRRRRSSCGCRRSLYPNADPRAGAGITYINEQPIDVNAVQSCISPRRWCSATAPDFNSWCGASV